VRRPRQVLSLVPILCVAALSAATLVAQSPQARALPAPDATYKEPFTTINSGSVRELSSGRVIVIDGRDQVVRLIDFASGSATQIGREGSGPAEFRQAMRLFVAAADTTYLVDRGNQRLLVIAPDGKPVSSFRLEGMGGPGASGGNGRYYFSQGPAVLYGSSGPVPVDTVPILRLDRTRNVLDTAAWVHPPKIRMERTPSGGITTSEGNPLNPADTWMALPDGRLAVVRSADYHVDFYPPTGRATRGAPIQFTPIRITDADKDAEEARRNAARQNQGRGRSLTPGGGTGAPAQGEPPPRNAPLPPLKDWPEVKPPFRWIDAIHATPSGDIWLQRFEPAGAKGSLFDVINAQGAVTRQVRLQDGWTLVGFGNGTVYTIKRDADDLMYLQRHKLP
jgi:hypothetical protein